MGIQRPDGSERIRRLLEALPRSREIAILPHDNPDPDSMASALALQHLLVQHRRRRPRILSAGLIGRPENRAMVTTLGIELTPANEVLPGFDGSIVLVDTQPGRANNSLPKGLLPAAVIDHHPDWGNNGGVPFVDLREHYGATSTILTEYLEEDELSIDRRVATALFYGVATETQRLGREATSADIRVSQALYPHVDKRKLAEIEHPPLSEEYFRLIAAALDSATVYGDVVVSMFNPAPYPDSVAEVADFLLRMQGIRWVACLAPHSGHLYVSLRASEPTSTAGLLLASLLPDGSAGGHGQVAGGRVRTPLSRWRAAAEGIVRSFLAEVGPRELRGHPLVGSRRTHAVRLQGFEARQHGVRR